MDHAEHGDDAQSHAAVMSAVGVTLSGLQQAIIALTAQLQEMQQKTAIRPEDLRQKAGNSIPWALSPEDRYPVKNPINYSEFERKYPPDRFGEEATNNARVWKIYRDRATELDQDKIDGWNKTLDILLIFAGLFSAVASAFLVESYQLLQQDYTQYLAFAFFAAQTNITLPDPAAFTASGTAKWTNGLWFSSLSLALTVALLAILAKQWLEEYSSRMRAHVASHRRWAWRHLAFSAGLTKWNVDAFISALPFLLHVALFLFFVGLAIFLWNINLAISIVVIIGTLSLLVFYVLAMAAPLWYGECPSATPLLRQMHAGYREILRALYRAVGEYRVLPSPPGALLIRRPIERLAAALRKRLQWRLALSNWATFDETTVLSMRNTENFDVSAVQWMVTRLPSDEECAVALDCIGSLSVDGHRQLILQANATDGAFTGVCGWNLQNVMARGLAADELTVARCLRTMAFLGMDVNRQNVPNDVWISLSRWRNLKTYDLPFLARSLSSNTGDSVPAVSAWSELSPKTPAFLPSTLQLLLVAQRTRSLEELLDLFVCGLFGLQTSQSHYPMMDALNKVLDQMRDRIESDAGEIVAVRPDVWRMVAGHEYVLLRALKLFGFLGEVMALDRSSRFHVAYSATLEMAHDHFLWLDLRLPSIEHVLWYVGTDNFLRQSWSHMTVNKLGSLFAMTIDATPPETEMYWSSELNNILRNWLLQDASPAMEGITATIMYAIATHLAPELPTDLDRALSESVLNILRRPSSRSHGARSSSASGSRVEDVRSTWRIALAVGYQGDRLTFCKVARMLSVSLLSLHRGGVDVSALLHELVDLSDETSILMMYVTPDVGVQLARSGRAISEDWWRDVSKKVKQVPADRWDETGGFETPARFVEFIEETEV